jgi:hypothetical protein
MCMTGGSGSMRRTFMAISTFLRSRAGVNPAGGRRALE